MPDFRIRHMEEADLSHLVEISRLDSAYPDPDFEELQGPWHLDRADILAVVRQRKDDARGSCDTRAYVLETPARGEDGVESPWVCGGFALELQPVGWEIVYFVADPSLYHYDSAAQKETGSVLDALDLVCEFVQEKACKSEKRKQVRVVLWDRDEAHLRSLLPFWRGRDFEVKLKRDYFPGNTDGWLCTWTAQESDWKKSLAEPLAA
jgi:hypothetical protein